MLRTIEGGRRGVIASGYRPNWGVGPIGSDGLPAFDMGAVILTDREVLELGDEAEIRIKTFHPQGWLWAPAIGNAVPVYEGPNHVGDAIILEVLHDPST